MGNNCSLVSPRQDGMVLIRHPYKLEKFNTYLDSKNVFRIVKNEVSFDNVKKIEEQNVFEGVKNDNVNFCELDLDLGETCSQENKVMKHKYKLPSAIEKDLQISDKECIGKFPKHKKKIKKTKSNQSQKRKTCMSCNKMFSTDNSHREDCDNINNQPITNKSNINRHKRRSSVTLHKPSNNTLLINYCANMCNNTHSRSKYKFSSQNTHERINTAITAVSSNNLSDISKTSSSSSNNQNKSNSSSKDNYIYPSTNKLFMNNLSDIKSSIEEINSNSIKDNIHLTKQLGAQFNEYQLSSCQAFQITNNINSQVEKEIQFSFPKSSSNEQCSTRSSHQKETTNNNNDNNQQTELGCHNNNNPERNPHPHPTSSTSQMFSLNNNNNLIFSKLHSEQNVQFSIVDTHNNNISLQPKYEPLSPSGSKIKPKTTVSTKSIYNLNSPSNKDIDSYIFNTKTNKKSNTYKGQKDKQKSDKKVKNIFFKKIIVGSELKKLNNNPDKVSYANRYCVLTASDLQIYKSKEDFVLVKPPLLIIPLSNIVNVNMFILNKTQNKDKMHHFVITYNNNNSKDITNSLDVSSSELQQDDTNVEVEYFGNKDLKLIKQWIKEIKYWKNNA